MVETSGIMGFNPKIVEGPVMLVEGVIIYDIGDIPPTLGSGNFMPIVLGVSLITGDA